MVDTLVQLIALVSFLFLGRLFITSPARLIKLRHRFLQGVAPSVYNEQNHNETSQRYYDLLYHDEEEWKHVYSGQVMIARLGAYFLFLCSGLLVLQFVLKFLAWIVS